MSDAQEEYRKKLKYNFLHTDSTNGTVPKVWMKLQPKDESSIEDMHKYIFCPLWVVVAISFTLTDEVWNGEEGGGKERNQFSTLAHKAVSNVCTCVYTAIACAVR